MQTRIRRSTTQVVGLSTTPRRAMVALSVLAEMAVLQEPLFSLRRPVRGRLRYRTRLRPPTLMRDQQHPPALTGRGPPLRKPPWCRQSMHPNPLLEQRVRHHTSRQIIQALFGHLHRDPLLRGSNQLAYLTRPIEPVLAVVQVQAPERMFPLIQI